MKQTHKKKLNIVYLDFDDKKNPLLAAGQATATYGAATELVRMGHKVTVLCSKYPGYKDRLENGIYYKHIAFGTKNIILNNALYILFLPFFVPKIKADIIIECFTAPISTLFSPLFTKIPVVVLPSMFNAKEFSRKYHIPFHWIEAFGIRFYKYFMPYSNIDSGKIKRMNKNAIYKIIPQGVSDDYFAIQHKNPEYILFLSRFDIAQKGIDLLLQAYGHVVSQVNYPLVLAGHGPDEEKIQNLVKKFHLEKHVIFAGSAYGKKKEKLLSKAICVAFPSRHDELSLWALEALASGLPLVTFDLPEGRWASDSVRLSAKPFNIEEYASLLVKATEPKLNATLRKNARSFARQFSWQQVAQKFESFFYEIIEKEKHYGE